MNRFVQLHLLTSYPPANLNRDDLGRPKTAMMGNALRLRVSSQSLKRAWRTSEAFESALKNHIGTRTKEMGVKIFNQFIEKEVSEKKALEWSKTIAGVFGKIKILSKDEEDKLKDDKTSNDEKQKLKLKVLQIEQLAHFSPEEENGIGVLVTTLAQKNEAPTDDELKLLRQKHTAADIALFGRMLASSPAYNTEAACQVAHAISVHKIAVEDDFFTAIDDLNAGQEDLGAGHMGETEFAAGLFYQYICIDRELLKENLSGDEALTKTTIEALIEASATVAPTGKQNSFGSRARAEYILCEVGNQQPRSLSTAFISPIQDTDVFNQSIRVLNDTMEKMDSVYEKCAEFRSIMNAKTGEGSLVAIKATATE